MVDILVPTASTNRYFVWMDWLCGPCDRGNYSSTTISIPCLSRMSEVRGNYGENDVIHDKIKGTIEYHPLLNGVFPAPTQPYPYFPNRVRITGAINYYGGVDSDFYAWNGIAGGGAYAYQRQSAATFTHSAIFRAGGGFTLYLLSGSQPDWATAIYKYEVTKIIESGSKWLIYYRRYTYTWTDFARSSLYGQPMDGAAIKAIIDAKTPAYYRDDYDSKSHWTFQASSVAFDPKLVEAHVDAIIAQLLFDGFPIEEEDYGLIAMRACEKTNALSVNMLEFLKDLRDVRSLIPKLINLRSLKEVAGGFLKIQYGYLPTIRDLERIVGAFRKRKKFFDKNQFSVYTASNVHPTVTVNGGTYGLEQRVKIAIADEDDDFERIIESLDSVGVLPTFERLWDLVRYSFVVDWFVNVGAFLERIDGCLRVSRLNIKYATMSRKKTVSKTIQWSFDVQHPYSGQVEWSHYHRWVTDHCPTPPLIPPTPSGASNHWLEGGALLVQRIK